MKTMWKFKTAHWTIKWSVEDDTLSTQYMDPDLARECREKVGSGEWVCFSSTVTVSIGGRVLGETYLGNSIYSDPAEFRDHFGCRPKGYGSYFSDMVRETIADARRNWPDYHSELGRLAGLNIKGV